MNAVFERLISKKMKTVKMAVFIFFELSVLWYATDDRLFLTTGRRHENDFCRQIK